jgi:hypothetical protein
VGGGAVVAELPCVTADDGERIASMNDLDDKILSVVKTNDPADMDILAEAIPDADREAIRASVERLKKLGKLGAIDPIYRTPVE